jgi:hypothetical protein
MKEIISALVKLADHLDTKGYHKEASLADEIIKKAHSYLQKKAEDEEDGMEKDGEEKEMMAPMADEEKEKVKDGEEAACMGNLKHVQLRQRARQRRLLLKNS